MRIADFLATLEAFHNLGRAEAERVARFMVVMGFKGGEHIIRKGEQGDRMYVVRDGRVYAPVINEEGERIRARMGPGEVFGEMALLTGEPRNADVIAETDCTVVSIPRPVFEELVSKYPNVASYLTRTMGDRLTSRGAIERVGKYDIVGLLGRGGMSIVYEGIHPALERPVAIKMLAHSLVHEEQFAQRFRHEAKLIANLRHPNIVEVFDWEEAYATTFIIMEKLVGMDLKDLLQAREQLEPAEVRDIVVQVATALEHAHSQGIVHRDVKPSNILLREDGVVKLMDFGIAYTRELESSIDVDDSLFMGTPTYASPEQAHGLSVDHRADIYALGVVAFELLTGKPPYQEPSLMGVLAKHVTEPMPDASSEWPHIPEDLLDFMRTACEKDPLNRFQSCGDVVAHFADSDRSRPASTGVQVRTLSLVFTPEAEKAVEGIVSMLQGVASRIDGLVIK